jgi:hypothetical protein
MTKKDYVHALICFREAEMIVDIYLEHSEEELNDEVVLFLLVNLGICFYHYAFFDDAFSCFESCETRL